MMAPPRTSQGRQAATRPVELRKFHRLFYPQVPAVLCASYGGRTSAMPVVSYASLSERPPLVGVSCGPESYTTRLAAKARSFSLCWLDRRFEKEVSSLATTSGRAVRDKLQASGLAHARGEVLGVPVISTASAVLECSLSDRVNHGDHLLLVGLVEAARASTDFKDYWSFRSYDPILYAGWKGHMSTYRR